MQPFAYILGSRNINGLYRWATMSDTKMKRKTEAEMRQRTEELERRVKAEGLDLERPDGKERFEELMRRVANSNK